MVSVIAIDWRIESSGRYMNWALRNNYVCNFSVCVQISCPLFLLFTEL